MTERRDDPRSSGGAAAAAASPVAGLRPGLTIGRYELVSRIATGGMGEVFLARAVGAGGFAKDVVIKRILPHLASDPGFVQRFIEEGKLVVRLRHAGIAQVLDMDQDDGVFFIAMEHVDGKDLGELVRIAAATGKRMPVPLVVHLLVALLDALDYAHHARATDGRPLGIIHRDVSPSNVMVGRSGEVKLLDFGIARAAERLQHSTTGAIRGKYSYMSPQQAAGIELDARSDLFSVGVIAWELLTGERPFDGASDLLTLDRIRFHDPGRLRDHAPDVPEDLAAIVERLLAKEPDARFASAEAVAQALRAHIVRSGHLATSKELSAWVEELLGTLPEKLRERSMQGMSIDDVLRMSLASEPSMRAAATPSDASPLPGARPETVVAAAPPPSAIAASDDDTDETAPRRRARFPVVLVGLNLVLIALVLFLVLRSDSESEAPSAALGAEPSATATHAPDALAAADPADAAAAPVAATTTADPSPSPSPAASDHDIAIASAEDTRAEPPPAPQSGQVAGAALGALDDVIFASDVTLVIRSNAPDATVAVSGLGIAHAPRVIHARPGTILTGRVSAPAHEPRLFEAVVGRDDSITVTLKEVPRGKLHFRFFPAEGTRVEVDGAKVATSSNTISIELPVGKHTLVLESRDGQHLRRSFTIEPNQTTSLGTLDVGAN